MVLREQIIIYCYSIYTAIMQMNKKYFSNMVIVFADGQYICCILLNFKLKFFFNRLDYDNDYDVDINYQSKHFRFQYTF